VHLAFIHPSECSVGVLDNVDDDDDDSIVFLASRISDRERLLPRLFLLPIQGQQSFNPEGAWPWLKRQLWKAPSPGPA
jgi:hypothetical protein